MDSWRNEHCPVFVPTCPFGSNPKTPENRSIACLSYTPWIDNYSPNAQLNHYWTLSLADFLRKIHRGKGGSYSKTNGASFRNTGKFFKHATPNRVPFVEDHSFIDRYGLFFADLKVRCPACFDLRYLMINCTFPCLIGYYLILFVCLYFAIIGLVSYSYA